MTSPPQSNHSCRNRNRIRAEDSPYAHTVQVHSAYYLLLPYRNPPLSLYLANWTLGRSTGSWFWHHKIELKLCQFGYSMRGRLFPIGQRVVFISHKYLILLYGWICWLTHASVLRCVVELIDWRYADTLCLILTLYLSWYLAIDYPVLYQRSNFSVPGTLAIVNSLGSNIFLWTLMNLLINNQHSCGKYAVPYLHSTPNK